MESLKPHISVVSPEYKGEKMVHELVERVVASVSKITDNYEIILVNDASPDNTWEAISAECAANSKVKGLNLSRNFGQHYAITAGLRYASGDWVVVMDCDLQDVPEEIPNLYKKAQEGYDIVFARRKDRKDGFLKKMSSRIFHIVFDWLSGVKSDKSIANYGIYKDIVITACNQMDEVARSFGTLVAYVGFKSCAVDVIHSNRAEGESSYNINKLIKLSFDIMISNSNKPLRLAVSFGFIMAIFSFFIAVYNIIAREVGIITVDGFTTTVFSVWFVGGILLSVIGIVGLYVGKIFDQVKGRALFIVKDKINIL